MVVEAVAVAGSVAAAVDLATGDEEEAVEAVVGLATVVDSAIEAVAEDEVVEVHPVDEELLVEDGEVLPVQEVARRSLSYVSFCPGLVLLQIINISSGTTPTCWRLCRALKGRHAGNQEHGTRSIRLQREASLSGHPRLGLWRTHCQRRSTYND